MRITLDALKNPKVVFAAINHFMLYYGEDFIDQNESIVASNPFIIWLQGKGYIDTDLADKMIEEVSDIQSLLKGCDEGLFPLHGECGNQATYKGYALLAEYISSFHVFRERLYRILEGDDEPDVEDDEDDEDSLLDLPDGYLAHQRTLTDEIVAKKSGFFFNDCSFVDGYEYFSNKQISECDMD